MYFFSATKQLTSINLPSPGDTFIKCWLYTPDNQHVYTELRRGNIKGILINNTLPLKVIIHGYMNNVANKWMQDVKNAYVKKHCNVILVDWSSLAYKIYPEAKDYIKDVAYNLFSILFECKTELGIQSEDMHLIGHSLGAHIAGICGYLFIEKYGSYLARISGLDPAGPLFDQKDSAACRLTPTSALFVDAIYTNIQLFGSSFDVAVANFFPNGGENQPGCFFGCPIGNLVLNQMHKLSS